MKKSKNSSVEESDSEKKDEGEDTGEEEEENSEEEKEMGNDDKKVTGEDLQKSLDKLEEVATHDDAPSRKEVLLGKANEGELKKSERDELFEILGGAPVSHDDSDLTDEITKSLTDNDDLNNALNVDVSGYLREMNDSLVKSLETVGTAINQSENRQNEKFLVMAKAVHDIGSMVKSLADVQEEFLEKPAHKPKSLGLQGAEPMHKSFGGADPAGENLSKSMMLNTMVDMTEKSLDGEGDGKVAGEDMAYATAKFESDGLISPKMIDAVKQYRAAAR